MDDLFGLIPQQDADPVPDPDPDAGMETDSGMVLETDVVLDEGARIIKVYWRGILASR